ncbi:MAG: hypothetical protein J6W04_04305 [Bacteroidales bacterium]|nr:hypothetical protein [Bacteroidales bacterium]
MKEWFWSKQGYGTYGPYCEHVCTVNRETERAYQVVVFVKNSSFVCWVPKSCTVATFEEMTEETINAEERKAEYEKRRQERYEAACKEYAELIAYAQKMGVRGVREGLRRETIERKIQNAGIPLPA